MSWVCRVAITCINILREKGNVSWEKPCVDCSTSVEMLDAQPKKFEEKNILGSNMHLLINCQIFKFSPSMVSHYNNDGGRISLYA